MNRLRVVAAMLLVASFFSPAVCNRRGAAIGNAKQCAGGSGKQWATRLLCRAGGRRRGDQPGAGEIWC